MNPRYLRSKSFSSVPVLWKPNENSGRVIKKLMKIVEEKYQIKFNDYWGFYKWSIDNYPEYWEEMWEFTGVICSKKYHTVIDRSVPMSDFPKWFEGAELNFAENLLKFRDDKVALILASEDRATEKLTYSQLYEETKLYAAAFRKFGVRKGDVIMCYMSNRKEAVIGMLAAVSIGAIWTGALPQLGHEAVISRVSQVNPKILLTLDRFSFINQEINMLSNVEEIAKALPSLEKVIIIPSKGEKKNISKIRNGCFLDEFLALGRETDGSVPEMTFEQVSFSYPVFINYTSGTTGIPKALIHGSGVMLITARDFHVHLDMERGDVTLSISPVGWASWCCLTTLIFHGLTLVLHEGNPFYLSPTSIWDMIEEFKLSHILITPSCLDELEKRRYVPTKKHNLSCLKTIFSGGSIVKLKAYDFIYDDLKLDVLFSSAYGCTEIMGIAYLETTLPVYKGETPTPSLGTLLEVYDESTGKPVFGEVGDLVISIPNPGMTLGLVGDTNGSLFREKYYTKYPGKFFIGDSAIINPYTNGLIVCGRCDDTIKQRGCRFGCSEIYNVVDHFSEVHDSLVASQYNKDLDERAILFVKMKESFTFNEDLVKQIRRRIADDLTPRHVPDVIIETKEIPFNANGKKMEILVKKLINNLPFNDDVLINPGCLKYYKNRPELKDF